MELRHLRYFAALAQTLHFTRAAEQVHVSQSTLSHQIRQLEEELGKPLFTRIGKRIHLNQDGQVFLASVACSLSELDNGIIALKGPSPELESIVRIGTTATLAGSFVPECAAAFLADNPSSKLSIAELTPDEIRAGVLDRSLHVGVAYPPLDDAGLTCAPLFEERMLIVAARTHPLASRRRLRLADLHAQRVMLTSSRFSLRRTFDDYFRLVGAEPVIVVDGIGSVSAIRPILLSTDLVAILPETAHQDVPELRAIPIDGPCPTRFVHLYYENLSLLPASARNLVSLTKRAALMRTRRTRRS